MKLIGVVEAPEAMAVFGDFAVAEVSWSQPTGGLLFRYESAGGVPLVECYVEEVTGVLYSMTILDLPTSDGRLDLLECDVVERGLPVVDRSPWQLNPDNAPERRFAADRGTRSVARTTESVTVQLDLIPVERWLAAGPVMFGVSAEDVLVAIRVAQQT